MSTKGVYTALSGAMAQTAKMDTVANNIANANTPGFKRDQQVFQEYLSAFEKEPTVNTVPRVVASIDSFYPLNGGDQSFVDLKGTFTDFAQGSVRSTGNPLDVAVDGKGMFEVMTPAGMRFTRAGNFTMDGSGKLVTKDGFPVMQQGAPGADPESRIIKFDGQQAVSITDQGDVFQGTDLVGKLSIVEFAKEDSIQKEGNSLYGFKSNAAPEVFNAANPSVRQGFLEMSNVNIVQEMTDMITTQRVFESTQKAISAYDQLADKLINQVGKTTAG